MAEITERKSALQYAADRGWVVATTELAQQGLMLRTDRWTHPSRKELVIGVWAEYRDMYQPGYWAFGVVEVGDRRHRIEALATTKDDALSLERALNGQLPS